MESQFTWSFAELFLVILLILLFVVLPLTADKRTGFGLVALVSAWLLIMVIFVPIGRWTDWVTWLQVNWWVGLVVVISAALFGAKR